MILLFLYLPQSKYVEPSLLHNSAMPLHSPPPEYVYVGYVWME